MNKKIRELEQENAELKSQIVKRVPELMAAVVLDQQDDEEVDGKGLKTHGKLLIDSSDNAISYIIMMENATKTSMNHLI